MPSVFINYRAKDVPDAAGAIHAHLVRVFGKTEVFRDCVSMEPGEHYPSAIRAALAEARVLIAVIGPNWLAPADGGVRLIDRARDWVRLEIADAFRRGITVVPVMIKDGPKDAVLPEADELPENVRRLAHIQAFEFSHRRFRPDLDRLVDVLIRKGLRPAVIRTDPAVDRRELLQEMVDLLETMPSMRTEQDRQAVGNQLPGIAGSIRYSQARRVHIMNILEACAAHPGGVTQLVELLRWLDGSTVALPRLAELATSLADGEDL